MKSLTMRIASMLKLDGDIISITFTQECGFDRYSDRSALCMVEYKNNTKEEMLYLLQKEEAALMDYSTNKIALMMEDSDGLLQAPFVKGIVGEGMEVGYFSQTEKSEWLSDSCEIGQQMFQQAGLDDCEPYFLDKYVAGLNGFRVNDEDDLAYYYGKKLEFIDSSFLINKYRIEFKELMGTDGGERDVLCEVSYMDGTSQEFLFTLYEDEWVALDHSTGKLEYMTDYNDSKLMDPFIEGVVDEYMTTGYFSCNDNVVEIDDEDDAGILKFENCGNNYTKYCFLNKEVAEKNGFVVNEEGIAVLKG